MPRNNRSPLDTCEHCRFRVGAQCRRNPPIPAVDVPYIVSKYPLVLKVSCGADGRKVFEFSPGCFSGEVSK